MVEKYFFGILNGKKNELVNTRVLSDRLRGRDTVSIRRFVDSTLFNYENTDNAFTWRPLFWFTWNALLVSWISS